MPTIVASAVVGALGVTGIAGTIATAAIGLASSVALNSVAAKPKTSRARELQDRSEMIRSATAPRRVVYGQARVSGPIAFAHTSNGPAGQRNAVLHLLVPLAAHEIEGITDVYINDDTFTDYPGAQGWHVPPSGSKFSDGNFYDGVTGSYNPFQWRGALGTREQPADPFLLRDVPLWSDAHRLRGVAYIYARLYWNSSIWAAGLPNISAVVKGRKVYDPRTLLTVWSDNPALCIRDYLLSDFGMNCLPEEIDESSFTAAANLCDEAVDGGKRYTCNGVLALDEKPIDIMERLLSSCGGTLVYTQGQYKLYPAAYRVPVLTLDASCLRGGVKLRPQPPRRERANTISGTFINPAKNWQAGEFTPVISSIYRAADGGERIGRDMELAFTNDALMAQRLATLQLERSRRALTVEVPCTLAALDVAVMEPITLTLPELGWSEKVFVPTEWTLAEEGGIDLVLQEDDPQIYAWAGGVHTAAVPEVVLPGLIPAAPLLSLSDTVSGGLVSLIASASSHDEAFYSRTEFEVKRSSASDYSSAGSGGSITIAGVDAGESYDVRARNVNIFGATSRWTIATRQVLGGSTGPDDVAMLSGSRLDDTLYLEWAAPSGMISYYRLRWSALTSGALWSNAVELAPRITNLRTAVPARVGSYLLRAVDALGRESANAAVFVNGTPGGQGSSVVATRTEHPAFSGSKTNCVVNGSNQLIISSLTAFDAQSGNVDSASGNFDSAGGGAVAEGIYEFASMVDLGAKFVTRASVELQTSVIDLVADVDGAPGELDAREGLFDGTAPSAVDVVVEVARTDSDPAGSPVWSAWQPLAMGDVVGRGFKFRARLLTRNPMATPALEQLSVQLELPDRVAAAAGLTSASGGDSITFSPAFYDTPAITVTPTNLASGDIAVITARSRSGFTVQFKNSAGTGVSRSYDWVARGCGREQ